MKVTLIQVPYAIGDDRQGGSKGATRFIEAGVAERLARKGVDVKVDLVERGKPFRDSVSASAQVNRRLAQSVRRALAEDRLPLVLAGSCDASMGVLAGFEHGECGIVWFDAHGDFNTPETTISGFFGGMPLAVVAGHCYRHLWAQVGDNTPVAEGAIVMLGVRDLDPLEAERLEGSDLAVVRWRDGRAESEVGAALDELAANVKEVYVHIDLDALDPQIAPGIVDFMVPGGMSLEDVEQAILDIGARFRIKAASVATYNPDLDPDGKTLSAGLRIIEALAECAGSGPAKD
jgi:arginase